MFGIAHHVENVRGRRRGEFALLFEERSPEWQVTNGREIADALETETAFGQLLIDNAESWKAIRSALVKPNSVLRIMSISPLSLMTLSWDGMIVGSIVESDLERMGLPAGAEVDTVVEECTPSGQTQAVMGWIPETPKERGENR